MNKLQSERVFSRNDTAIAKLAAIGMMICHHLFTFPDRIPEGKMYHSLASVGGQPVEGVVAQFSRLCVAMFLFLSGYGIYIQLRKKKYLTAYIADKIKGLLMTLWKVMWVFVPLSMALGVKKVNISAVWDIEYSPLNFVLNMIGFPKGIHPFNGEWWFITAYLFLLIGVPAIFAWLRRSRDNFFSDLIVVMLIFLFGNTFYEKLLTYPLTEGFYHSPWCSVIRDILGVLPSFLMGFLFAKNQVFEYFRLKFRHPVSRIAVSFAVCLILFVFRWKVGGNYDFMLVGFFVPAIVTILRVIPGIPWLAHKISRYVTYIWLIHTFYCYMFAGEFIYSFRFAPIIWLVLAVLSYLSAVAVHWFWHGVGSLLSYVGAGTRANQLPYSR